MKDLFSWRFNPSEKDFIDLWENAIFVFDTNFLLDLYRVSQSTAQDFFNVLESLKERIWLPYQVADEFLNRREDVIKSEAESFQKALKNLKRWKEDQLGLGQLKGNLREAGRIVNSEVGYLFEQQNTYKLAIEEVEKCFKDKIEELAETHSPLKSEEDYILEKILTLFDGKVGDSYSASSLRSLYKEGAERYSQKKPPGFMDEKDKEGERKYGDFILWMQILDFAKTKPCSIVLVTGEKKEDWWTRKNGEIVSPRFELRREFQEQVKQLFWMYQTQRFLKVAKEKLKIEISPRSIEETNVVAEAEAAQAAEEKSYEEISKVIQQFQTARITEDLFNSLSIPPMISEDLLESLRNPLLGKSLLKSLSQPSPIGEMIRSLNNPIASESLLKLYSQLYKSAGHNPQATLKREERDCVPEDMELNSSTISSDDPMLEQYTNRTRNPFGNSKSIEDEPEAISQDIKPKARKRSSVRKPKEDNSEK